MTPELQKKRDELAAAYERHIIQNRIAIWEGTIPHAFAQGFDAAVELLAKPTESDQAVAENHVLENWDRSTGDRGARMAREMFLAGCAHKQKEADKWEDEYENVCKFAAEVLQEKLNESEAKRKKAVEILDRSLNEKGVTDFGISQSLKRVIWYAKEALAEQGE